MTRPPRRSATVTPSGNGPPVVTAHAVPIEHGLNLPGETEATGRSPPGADRRRVGGRQRNRSGWRGLDAGLMATCAADVLAGHGREPAPHELYRLALGIQRLERERRIGRDAEVGRAVLADRHGPQDPLDVPASVGTDCLVAPGAVVGVMVGEDAQPLHGAARHTCQTGTSVDVANRHRSVLAIQLHPVGNYRGAGTPGPGHRLQQGGSAGAADRHDVVEHVRQAQQPG